MITNERTKEIFVAMRLHLTSDYNFIKYNGRLRPQKISEKERLIYSRISNRVVNEKNAIDFFASNFLIRYFTESKVDGFIGNFCDQSAFKIYVKAKDWKDHYCNNLRVSLEKHNIRTLLDPKNTPPELVNKVVQQEIHPLAMVYLLCYNDKILNSWIVHNQDTIFLEDVYKFLSKIVLFYKVDRNQVKPVINMLVNSGDNNELRDNQNKSKEIT